MKNWYLSETSTNDEIKKIVFDSAIEAGYMVFGSVCQDGKTPTTRALEIQYLDDTGIPYIGFSEGKPIYQEMKINPVISGSLVIYTEGRRGYSIRINSKLTHVLDEEIYKEYWRKNPGTYALYKKGHDNFKLFKFESGDGELFDLCEDDLTHRYRFSFGNNKPREWYYNINDNCTGCGACKEACMMNIIEIINNKAKINHRGCLECGLCYESCKFNGITKGI